MSSSGLIRSCIHILPLQALDGDFSDENRNKCRVATAPLIEAVENLTTFASNPEFASVPAQISHEVGDTSTLVCVVISLDSCGLI